MSITAIVPIKLKNERLPGKNIKGLCGKPLIQYILESLDRVSAIDNTFVYCSDASIESYLTGSSRFLPRPAYLDGANTNFTQIFQEFIRSVDSDIYVYAHATSPFISSATIGECIEKVMDGAYDSAFTGEIVQDFLWRDGHPLNFGRDNLPRSQDLPKIIRESSGIYVFMKDVFLKTRGRIGRNPFIKEVSSFEAVDINTPDDFHLAEIILQDKQKNI